MDDQIPTTVMRMARDASGVRQADLAAKLGVSASVLSRLEASENADAKMAKRYLQSLATPLGDEIIEFFERRWRHLDRPDFAHPEKEAIWRAEEALQKLHTFEESRDFDPILHNPLNNLRKRLLSDVDFVRHTEHSIAFIGEIGVGKTTALSFVTNLLVPDGEKKTSVFPTGSGRMTVCEVAIKIAPAYGIAVDSMKEDEIRMLVSDLVTGLATGKGGLPSELDRVIRNMADVRRVAVRSRTPGEKPKTVDHLKELIDRSGDVDAVIAEVVARMKLETRTSTQIILSKDTEDSMDWLSKNISRINYGQHPDFSVPVLITVLLPLEALRETPYALSVIDTKGVEGTTKRQDLMKRIEDERTVTVLCCSFSDAPGNVPLSIMRDAIETGTGAVEAERICLLALPRNDEALKIVDDMGNRPGTPDEGYAIREGQIDQQFATEGLPAVPVNFFHVGEDSAQDVWEWLIGRIGSIRASKVDRISRHVEAAENLILNADVAKTRVARATIAETMRKAADRFSELPPVMRPAAMNLVAEVKSTHQSSVAASVTRRGEWDQFNASYILGQGVRRDVNLRTKDIFVRIDETIQGLKDNFGHLADVAQFLENLSEDVDDWRKELLSRVALSGRMLYSPHLLNRAGDLWKACLKRYGEGSGYRVDVSQQFQAHFDANEDALATAVKVENQVKALWAQLIIDALVESSAFSDE
ncbi:helix-turn-helix domain-containing protein [Rhizobium bangladeshense]|uniref:helix-turn-helix domain-containing protein n=1 Tax=Rhizobium bangladeshense TaxID=1138189 RepID=UPI0009ECDDF5|nr:helix-turn-helix domain-containing protein [Rhizobium bangladeshense]